jgi:hypothetical protein
MSLYEKLKSGIIAFYKIVLAIGSGFALFYMFKWMGLKGLSGLLLGMGIMAYLLLSSNGMIIWFVKLFRGDRDIIKMFGHEQGHECKSAGRQEK